jgi:hypothetical protein
MDDCQPERLWHCDWTSDDGAECSLAAGFYVEWDEYAGGRPALQFGACYCTAHLSQLRAGASPFAEYGGQVTLRLIRTVQAQQSLVAAARCRES